MKYSGTIGTSGTGAPIIVWQDVNGMVTNLSVAEATTENGYLKFYIAPNKIAEGNAVLAVKDSNGTIMWSWHIWACAYDIEDTKTINSFNSSYKFEFMPVNIGWVSTEEDVSYTARSVTIKIKQSLNEADNNLIIEQTPYNIPSRVGNSPYYQAGRKDPFVPWSGSGTTDKMVYGTYSSLQRSSVTSTITYPTLIKNPWCFYYHGSNNAYLVSALDKWDLGNTGYYNEFEDVPYKTSYCKSIYDPCPCGFIVPPPVAFTGFLVNNNHTLSIANTRGTSDWPTGWYLTNNETIYLPHLGIRAYDSGLLESISDVGSSKAYCAYHTSGRVGVGGSAALTYDISADGCKGSRYSDMWGTPIRAIRDKW